MSVPTHTSYLYRATFFFKVKKSTVCGIGQHGYVKIFLLQITIAITVVFKLLIIRETPIVYGYMFGDDIVYLTKSSVLRSGYNFHKVQ